MTMGYRDEVMWFGSVDLLRRIIIVLLIVALPGDEVNYCCHHFHLIHLIQEKQNNPSLHSIHQFLLSW